MTEELLGKLTSQQRINLVGRLFDTGYEYEFVAIKYGNVRAREVKPGHPRERDGDGPYIAVGVVLPDNFYLANTDFPCLGEHHDRLRDLYNIITGKQTSLRSPVAA